VHDTDLRRFDQRFTDDLDQVRCLIERDRTARGDRLGDRLCAFEELEPSTSARPFFPTRSAW
jgi:hypothetical protein